jgi:hypothetical protein
LFETCDHILQDIVTCLVPFVCSGKVSPVFCAEVQTLHEIREKTHSYMTTFMNAGTNMSILESFSQITLSEANSFLKRVQNLIATIVDGSAFELPAPSVPQPLTLTQPRMVVSIPVTKLEASLPALNSSTQSILLSMNKINHPIGEFTVEQKAFTVRMLQATIAGDTVEAMSHCGSLIQTMMRSQGSQSHVSININNSGIGSIEQALSSPINLTDSNSLLSISGEVYDNFARKLVPESSTFESERAGNLAKMSDKEHELIQTRPRLTNFQLRVEGDTAIYYLEASATPTLHFQEIVSLKLFYLIRNVIATCTLSTTSDSTIDEHNPILRVTAKQMQLLNPLKQQMSIPVENSQHSNSDSFPSLQHRGEPRLCTGAANFHEVLAHRLHPNISTGWSLFDFFRCLMRNTTSPTFFIQFTDYLQICTGPLPGESIQDWMQRMLTGATEIARHTHGAYGLPFEQLGYPMLGNQLFHASELFRLRQVLVVVKALTENGHNYLSLQHVLNFSAVERVLALPTTDDNGAHSPSRTKIAVAACHELMAKACDAYSQFYSFVARHGMNKYQSSLSLAAAAVESNPSANKRKKAPRSNPNTSKRNNLPKAVTKVGTTAKVPSKQRDPADKALKYSTVQHIFDEFLNTFPTLPSEIPPDFPISMNTFVIKLFEHYELVGNFFKHTAGQLDMPLSFLATHDSWKLSISPTTTQFGAVLALRFILTGKPELKEVSNAPAIASAMTSRVKNKLWTSPQFSRLRAQLNVPQVSNT